MIAHVHKKVKIHKTDMRAARRRRIAEVEKLVGGLTLDQLGNVCRYIKLLRSTTTHVQ